MAEVTISLDELKILGPCKPRLAVVEHLFHGPRRVGAAEALAAGATLGDLTWVVLALANRCDDVKRRLRLWAADCAARVLPIYEEEHPNDGRVREAIVASREFHRCEVQLKADAANRIEFLSDGAAVAASQASSSAARAAAISASEAAFQLGIGSGILASHWALKAACAKMPFSESTSTIATEEKWQTERLVAWLSADEPEDWPLASEEGR